MASIDVKDLTVAYNRGRTIAVDGLDMHVEDGEFYVLLGPSGCGKTTILYSIAGLLKPTSGEVKIGGKVVTSTKEHIFVRPQDRNIAMVFQEYALYPNMTVARNIGFPLENMGVEKEEIKRKVREISELLGIEDLLDRKPAQLSGGQRQRVALGRAIVRNPTVFLMDEPLGNLDAQLRTKMRFELKELQKRLQVTTVYVTHDQTEAMTMADKIMLLKDGRPVQVGTPEDLFLRPKNLFVGTFIGSYPMNLIECTLVNEESLYLETEGFRIPVPVGVERVIAERIGDTFILGVRPSDISEGNSTSANAYEVTGKVEGIEPMGDFCLVHASMEGRRLTAMLESTKKEVGDHIVFKLNPGKLYLFDKITGKELLHEK